MLMDTNRELQIGLGVDYPFGPLGAGECVISNHYQYTVKNVQIGQEIDIYVWNFGNLMSTMAYEYNL